MYVCGPNVQEEMPMYVCGPNEQEEMPMYVCGPNAREGSIYPNARSRFDSYYSAMGISSVPTLTFHYIQFAL